MGAELGTINRNYLFMRVYKSKLCFVSPYVVTYILPKKRGGIRVGITSSKKIGGAVVRNRARRVVRAAAFPLLTDADGSFDIVFVCRTATAQKKSTFISGVIKKQLKKAGVLAGE